MRVIVTGGSGFIGTNLVSHLTSELGASVLNIDVQPPQNSLHTSLFHEGDILDPQGLAAAFQSFEPTHLVHLAARTDLRGSGLEDYTSNTEGTANVVAAATKYGTLVRSVYASSRMVCDIAYRPISDDDYCPPNAYGASKVETERIVRGSAAPPWVIVRPTSIWGPYFGVPYRDFFDHVLAGRYLQLRGRTIEKSFGYIGNTCYQLAALLQGPAYPAGKTIYLGDYPPVHVEAMAAEIRAQTGKSPLKAVPHSYLRMLARLGDLGRSLGWKEPPLTSFRLRNLEMDMVYDLTELESLVGPLPYTWQAGVTRTLQWMDGRG